MQVRDAAAAEYALARELNGSPGPGSSEWANSVRYHIAASDREGAIERLEWLMRRDYGRWPATYSSLRYDPSAQALRNDPRVQAMLEQGERWLAEKRSAPLPGSSR